MGDPYDDPKVQVCLTILFIAFCVAVFVFHLHPSAHMENTYNAKQYIDQYFEYVSEGKWDFAHFEAEAAAQVYKTAHDEEGYEEWQKNSDDAEKKYQAETAPFLDAAEKKDQADTRKFEAEMATQPAP